MDSLGRDWMQGGERALLAGRAHLIILVYERAVCYSCGVQITVTIPDELAAQVRSRGLTPESYVEHLLAEQAASDPTPPAGDSLQEFDAALDQLARFSAKIPDLPDEALSRESIYQDHD